MGVLQATGHAEATVSRESEPIVGAGRGLRPRIFAAWVLSFAMAGCRFAESDVEYLAFEPAPFKVSLPAWQIDVDEGQGLSGRHRVIDGPRFAEVSWSPDRTSGREELEQIAASISAGFGLRHEVLESEQVLGQIRLHTRGVAASQGWHMSLIRCIDAGVTVTLTSFDRELTRLARAHARMVSGFSCSSVNPSDIELIWPIVDLPDDFGVLQNEELLFAHRDGRWLRVAYWSPSVMETMSRSPDMAQRVLAAVASALQMEIVTNGVSQRASNLNTAAHVWRVNLRPRGVMAVSAFACPQPRSGYLVLAADLWGATGYRDLKALSLRFGCPDGSGSPLSERQGICEAGAVALCKANGGSLPETVEDPSL